MKLITAENRLFWINWKYLSIQIRTMRKEIAFSFGISHDFYRKRFLLTLYIAMYLVDFHAEVNIRANKSK